MPQQTSPTPSPAPVLAPGQVFVGGGSLLSSPQAVYQGYKAQRQELARELQTIESRRADLASQLGQQEPPVTGAARTGLEQRITALDGRIVALDKQISDVDELVAKAAGVPGAAVQPPEPPRTGPPEEAWVVGSLFIVVVFLPLSIAFARRLWRRGGQIVSTIPKELSERLGRVEQTVEATAIEIERIGEGQRFMTRLFTEGTPPHALPATSGEPLATHARPGDVRP